ncbi:head-tail adaptor protein [Sphingomonas morindae]|uniref:Head-tail adaptor protein n=1 Tax=Sphingomonas morindae TaxID=1541170 RepID=A0ABY4X3M5_9SPHN|nr:head-tail adaptor protein [Sphingomonas morindae]USI71470.1 head-tail adaptor protein [Sphingomonas morindae]
MSGLASALRERVRLLMRDETRDALGGAAGLWREGPERWAAVRGDGFSGAGDARFLVTLRASQLVLAAERVRWRGRLYAIWRAQSDPLDPERIVFRVEALRGASRGDEA